MKEKKHKCLQCASAFTKLGNHPPIGTSPPSASSLFLLIYIVTTVMTLTNLSRGSRFQPQDGPLFRRPNSRPFSPDTCRATSRCAPASSLGGCGATASWKSKTVRRKVTERVHNTRRDNTSRTLDLLCGSRGPSLVSDEALGAVPCGGGLSSLAAS